MKNDDYLPHYTVGEEIFNSVSHGVGIALACVGFGILIILSVLYGDVWAVVSSIVYSFSLFTLYLASTLYHACSNRTVKAVLQILDHCSIFLLIAGTYTPFTLITLRGPLGWTLFGVVWAAAIVGIVLNAIDVKKFSKVSMVCYLHSVWHLFVLGGSICQYLSIALYVIPATF